MFGAVTGEPTAKQAIEDMIDGNQWGEQWPYWSSRTIYDLMRQIDRGYSVTRMALNDLVREGKVSLYDKNYKGLHTFRPVPPPIPQPPVPQP